MKLYEYMAKDVLRENGLPVPPGRLARTPEEAEAAARVLGPCVIKAQVLVGGRGKAGGVKPAHTPEEARTRASEILGMNLKGYVVESVYVESMLGIDQEFYLGITMDNAGKRPLLIASASGGMEIEEVPERAIVRQPIPVEWGLMPYATRWVANRLGLSGGLARQFGEIALKLYDIFHRYDAELVEINPLVRTGDRLVAADARLNVDDDALYRHPELPRTSEATELERRVRELGLAYVELDGDIAVMANGAGITMATLDVLQRYGGRPMNFLDAGGGASAEPMAEALKVLVSTRPKAIFINIFGGITRCDDVAQAVITARREVGISMPMVVRLVGTNEEKGVEMLRGEGIQAYRSMEEAGGPPGGGGGGGGGCVL
ncbi:MAG: ADP-forming succinate--CoA ligase subunit beta [Clostridia bacterium]|nr:ADP-forming succinate--CoA ligase subunit beta [Clostridia bacterium]